MDIITYTEKGKVVVTVMHVEGNIDASSSQAFQDKADKLIDGGAQFILVDLSFVPFVSSSGLRVLQHIYDRLRKQYPDLDVSDEDVKKGIQEGTYKSPLLKLLNPSNETSNTFQMSGFDMFIDIFKDKTTAIASFKQID